MTDRLTDEQVQTLWYRAETERTRRTVRDLWVQAAKELGYGYMPRSYLLPHEYETVRNRVAMWCSERDLPMDLLTHSVPGWDVVEKLLAEVRRARGME